ncbi:MAG: DNA repair protein RecO C-terminal domain-containing protein [Treponema sp.]|nr:DNA repair protein RecO C-terminal domain-containing protein [Treponema sp.]
MSRTAVYSALVLRNRPSGESNSEVTLLTAEEGIIRATVFGGAKSKLRAHSAPYNSGQVWIYRDKAKDYSQQGSHYAKLSDFDVHSWRPGLRELYERTMTAGAVSETILSSHGGGGDWGIALKLAIETLDVLEEANEELCNRLLVHFLWRWAGFMGIQPHLEYCAACEKNTDGTLWFNAREGTLTCETCLFDNNERGVLLKLNAGCRKWLTAVEILEPTQLHRYSMDNKSFNEAKSLVTAVLSGVLGKRLASWDSMI